MQHGDDLQRTSFWTVNDQVGIGGKESYFVVGEVFTPMSSVGVACQEDDSIPNDILDTFCPFQAALFLDVPPDSRQITRCLGSEDIARRHSGRAFRPFGWASSCSSGIPSPWSSCAMPRPILALIASLFSRSQRSCSSCVSSKRSNTSSTLAEPVASNCF